MRHDRSRFWGLRLGFSYARNPSFFSEFWSQEREMAQCRRRARQFVRCVWCGTSASSSGALEMPRYRFVVRHSAYADLEDDEAGTELPDDAAAREFASKVIRGLVRQQQDDWHGWTMEVRQGARQVWQLPFDAIEGTSH